MKLRSVKHVLALIILSFLAGITVAYAKDLPAQTLPVLSEFIGGVQADAVWQLPTGVTYGKLLSRCGSNKTCSAGFMRSHGAGPQAIAFNRYTSGIIQRYQQYGKVYVVFATIPAAGHGGIYLINSLGKIMEIDNWLLMHSVNFLSNNTYQDILKQYPRAMVGDNANDAPEQQLLDNGGQKFVMRYPIQNGCHACAVVGWINYAFEFDNKGTWVNASLVDVTKTP